MPFNLPANFSINPENFLRRSRHPQPESPPAPPPPNYHWKPESNDTCTPDKTIRTIYPTSSHSLVDSEPTNTPDVQIVREFFDTALAATPHAPGGFIFTPMPKSQSGSSDATTVKGKDVEGRPSKDEIIEALHERMKQLEAENQSFQAQADATAADRRRIDALEATISQLVTNQSPGTGNSGGSQNPFLLIQCQQNNQSTPTPMGPRAGQFNTSDGTGGAETAPVLPSKPRPAPLEPIDQQINVERSRDATDELRDNVRRVSIQAAIQESEPTVNSRQEDQQLPEINRVVENHVNVKKVSASEIKISEVPKFTGPSENPGALFNWRRLIEQYFTLKNITSDDDRRIILGSVLIEPRAGLWFVNSASDLKELTWSEMMNELAVETLPTGWLEDTEKSIRQLKMGVNEDFKAYVGRARDLYNMVQVQTSLSPRNLAEYIVWGAPDVFQRWVKDHGLLQVANFKMLPFISAAGNVWDVIQASNLIPRQRFRQTVNEDNQQVVSRPSFTTNNPASDTRTPEQRADSAWRYHQYMRHKGLCGYCRPQCGNAQCRGPARGAFVTVPDSFNPGPRPVKRQDVGINPWVRPPANSQAKPIGPPGAPTSKPAGRAVQPPTLVASVNQTNTGHDQPSLFAQEIARYEEADRVLVAHMAEDKADKSRRNELNVGPSSQESTNPKTTTRGTD